MSKTMTQDAIAHEAAAALALAFVRQFSAFTPYCWTADEGWSEDQGGDAITCMNDLISQARKIVGLPPIPDSLVGEQEDAP